MKLRSDHAINILEDFCVIVLYAINTTSPSLPKRYFSKILKTWIQAKRNISDEEFYKKMKRAYEL